MDGKAKILIFAHIYLPWIGGAEIAVKELTDRLDRFDFTMITAWRDRKLPRLEIVGKIKVYRVGLGLFQLDQYLYPLLAPFKALSLAKRENISLSWAMMPSQAGLAALFFRFLQLWFRDSGSFLVHARPRPDSASHVGAPRDSLGNIPEPKQRKIIPYLLTDQSGDSEAFWRARTWWWFPIFKLIYKKADRVQVISKYLADRARRFGYKGLIDIIPNGVDIEKFSRGYSEAEKVSLKRRLGLKARDKVIIHTGRLANKNGLDLLIRATNQLFKSQPELSVKLLLTGSKDQESGLRTLVYKLGLEKQIIFLGDIPNSEIPKYLSLADVFARPSRSEGQGISFIEAMAAGVAVIATPVGGIVDFLRDHETGLFCQVDDVSDLASKIELLLSDARLRETTISQARQLVEEKYNWRTLCPEMSSLFSSLINN